MRPAFLTGIRIERLKYRHSSFFWLTLGAAILMPVMHVISCLVNPELYGIMMRRAPWHFFVMSNWHDISAITLPVYVILLMNAVGQTEYRNNAWKQVYTSPRSHADIFFSKFILTQVMIVLFIIYSNGLILLAGSLVFELKGVPDFYRLTIPWDQIGLISVRVYIGVLTISILQYWLSIRFRNFMTPVGLGLGLLFGCLLAGKWVPGHLYSPYLLPMFMFFFGHSNEHFSLNLLYMISLGSFMLALSMAFVDSGSRKEKG